MDIDQCKPLPVGPLHWCVRNVFRPFITAQGGGLSSPFDDLSAFPLGRPLQDRNLAQSANEQRSHEKILIHGNPDRSDPERGGGGPAGKRDLPQARHQFGLVLPMEIQVRRLGRVGVGAAQGAGSGERQAEAAVRRYGIGKQCHEGSKL